MKKPIEKSNTNKNIGKIQKKPTTSQRDKIPIRKTSPNSLSQKVVNKKKKQQQQSKDYQDSQNNKKSRSQKKDDKASPNIKSVKSNKVVKDENQEKIDKALLSAVQKTNKDFIKVFVRFRPLNDLENGLLSDNCGWTLPKYISDTTIGIYPNKETKDKNLQVPGNLTFKYDKIFKVDSVQNEIYEYVGKRIVNDVMEGYNGTIFAYGQSGSGKTYTMYGPDIFDDVYKGIIPRIAEDIFNYVEKADDNIDFQFKLSVLEIYKEVLYDLLSQQNADLKIQENPETGIVIDGLSEVYLSSINEFFDYAE